MDKTAIKNFSVWARNALIRSVADRCGLVGVRPDSIQEPLPQSTRDMQFFDAGTGTPASISGDEIKKRDALVSAIRGKERDSDYNTAYNYMVEQVAYTWFNRLIAIRFMEVNDYLPSRIRVLSSEQAGKLEPDILSTPFDAEFDFTPQERDAVIQWKDRGQKEDMDALFRLLFVKQCNALHEILPNLFQKVDGQDYTELLLNISFTDRDGVVYRLVNDIPESNFDVSQEGQVEIIGWLYQYYNTDLNALVYDGSMSKSRITKELLPAATTIYTPDWAIKYMVENSLGHLWVEGHPNDGLKENWRYYLEEAEQEPEVQAQLAEIRKEYAALNPEDIKVIDPCMGSGHILVYAFDVLMQIYESQGYTQRDAAQSILANNLFGLDIDERVAQLAYFAVMMKARQYDRRILTRGIEPHVYAIKESGYTDVKGQKNYRISPYVVEYFCDGDKNRKKAIDSITEELFDAAEYGSILRVSPENFVDLYARFDEIRRDINILQMETLETLLPLVQHAEILAQKYDVVVTNPPYMGKKSLNDIVSRYLETNYPKGKSELYSAFILKCLELAKTGGYVSMITIHTWMFIASFENLRKEIIDSTTISSMVHTGASTFEELNSFNVLATTFTLKKQVIQNYKEKYIRLATYYDSAEKIRNFHNSDVSYTVNKTEFTKVPGSPFVYWISNEAIANFSRGKALRSYAEPKQGMATTNNNLFLRLWQEISYSNIGFDLEKETDTLSSPCRWFPYNKGGDYRKWYGNNEYVVNFQNMGAEVCAYIDKHSAVNHKGRVINREYYFKRGITWSLFGFENFGVRFKYNGFIFDVSGSSMFPDDDIIFYILAFLAGKVSFSYLSVLAPTVNFQVGNIGDLPLCIDERRIPEVTAMAKENIDISRDDWDSYETSWDFKRHPLV